VTSTQRAVEIRRNVGFILRLPLALFAALLWVMYVWWWIAGIRVAAALLLLILQPVAYRAVYFFKWLGLAFSDSTEEVVLPNYWAGYPERYYQWCREALTFGFAPIVRFLFWIEQ
jgi:hypothetical protein